MVVLFVGLLKFGVCVLIGLCCMVKMFVGILILGCGLNMMVLVKVVCLFDCFYVVVIVVSDNFDVFGFVWVND